jgi:hypothetical protein
MVLLGHELVKKQPIFGEVVQQMDLIPLDEGFSIEVVPGEVEMEQLGVDRIDSSPKSLVGPISEAGVHNVSASGDPVAEGYAEQLLLLVEVATANAGYSHVVLLS